MCADIVATGWRATELAGMKPGNAVVIYGATAIDHSKEDPVQRVMDLTHGQGADVGCECVGYQCHDHNHHRQERPNLLGKPSLREQHAAIALFHGRRYGTRYFSFTGN